MYMDMTKKIEQPSVEGERRLDAILGNEADMVEVRGGKSRYAVRWMKPGTMRRLTHVVLKEGNDGKASCMSAALIVLNDFWKISFFYPVLWRWFYYVRQYTDGELFPVIAAGKKKVPLQAFLMNITLMTEMKDTILMMKKEEVITSLRGQSTAPDGNAPKGTAG